MPDTKNSQRASKYQAQRAQYADAIAVNPVVNNPRLVELTTWDGPWAGLRVVVIGLGTSGDAAVDVLAQKGAHITAIDAQDTQEKRERIRIYQEAYGNVTGLFGEEYMECVPRVDDQDPDVIVTSPGIRPDSLVMLDAYERGIQIWSEIELAWRLNQRQGRVTPKWLCLTGTNGKTTTVGMVDSILKAAGKKSLQVGNVGMPAVYAVADDEPYEFFAVELSSFQLHWTSSLSPYASVVLNVAEDHVDWHGSFEAYKADKARVYENTQAACIFNTDHADTLRMVEEADVIEGARAIGISSTDIPSVSMLGLAENIIVDRAFLKNRYSEALELGVLEDLAPVPGQAPAQHTVENALAAAALCRAANIAPEAVRDGLRSYKPGAHRNQTVLYRDGIQWVNDSKATNPHAANASMSAYPSLIWIAGGLSKGVEYDDLIAQHASRLKAVLIIGTDTAGLKTSLAKYASHVPTYNMTASADDPSDGVNVMEAAVVKAEELAAEGDTVLMAPAAASMDQFNNYAVRGNVFVDAVKSHIVGN